MFVAGKTWSPAQIKVLFPSRVDVATEVKAANIVDANDGPEAAQSGEGSDPGAGEQRVGPFGSR